MWANKVRLRHESGSFKKKSRLAQSEKTWQLPEQRTLNKISLILAMERMIVLPGGACGEADKRGRWFSIKISHKTNTKQKFF